MSDPTAKTDGGGGALQVVGFWRDPSGLSDYPLAWPHPADLPKADWSPQRTGRVLAYLRGGVEAAAYCGMSMCRFEECGVLPCGTRDLTDGTWLWPEGLEHYVETHGVSLPESLVERADRGAVPADLEVDPLTPRTDRPWVEWTIAHTAPPPPAEDAASEAELRELLERLGTPDFEVELTAADQRWRLCFDPRGRRRVDYAPRLSLERLKAYLMRRRIADAERLLTLDEARQLARDVMGRRSLVRRIADVLKEGGLRRVEFKESAPRARPTAPLWHVRSGTVSGDCSAEDELGLRYILECMCSEGVAYHYAVQERYSRLLGPTLGPLAPRTQ